MYAFNDIPAPLALRRRCASSSVRRFSRIWSDAARRRRRWPVREFWRASRALVGTQATKQVPEARTWVACHPPGPPPPSPNCFSRIPSPLENGKRERSGALSEATAPRTAGAPVWSEKPVGVLYGQTLAGVFCHHACITVSAPRHRRGAFRA